MIEEFKEEIALSPEFFLDKKINAKPSPAKLSKEEFTDFYDLLSRMPRYSPEERLTIHEALQHPWMNKEYEKGFDRSDPWISHFDWGQDISTLEVVVNTNNASSALSQPGSRGWSFQQLLEWIRVRLSRS